MWEKGATVCAATVAMLVSTVPHLILFMSLAFVLHGMFVATLQ